MDSEYLEALETELRPDRSVYFHLCRHGSSGARSRLS